MCGILGQVGPNGAPAPLEDADAALWLDTLAHRGPDGRGSWRGENVWLGHTRLAIRDPESSESAQPMVTPCGRFALTFNGELYDDAEVRARIESRVRAATRGRGFATRCDAETLLWVLALEGTEALARIRGMYAFAFVDLRKRTLLLARDPLGVKPLVWTRTPGGFAFASEPAALTAHPNVSRTVDRTMVGAYLVTGRRVIAERTMVDGVRNVRAGNALEFDLNIPAATPRALVTGPTEAHVTPTNEDAAAEECRRLVRDSVHAHLASDVPVCALLSGGLDSAIVTGIATEAGAVDSTWCASGVEDGTEAGPDPAYAREVAARLGTRHTDVHVDRETYLSEWREHIRHLGAPLSTPNEIALARTARAIGASHSPVTLSGEGADELFGGYSEVLAAFDAHASTPNPPVDAPRFHLEATAWTSPATLAGLLTSGADDASAFVVDTFAREFDDTADTPLAAHLGLQRTINLVSLLERLDAATMRFGVEGRTPFSDARVLRFAEALPTHWLYRPGGAAEDSKRVLRRAFRGHVDDHVLVRPKASFPLPFQRWSSDVARTLASDPHLPEFVSPDALALVASNPRQEWRGAWLLSNLSLWLDTLSGTKRRETARLAWSA